MTEASQPSSPAVPVMPPPPAAVAAFGGVQRRPGGFDPATRRQTLIVAAVIAMLFFGTQILNESLPAATAADQITALPGNPVAIGGGWQITPVHGWLASPHDSGTGIRLEKGVVVIDLFPEDFDSAGDLAQAYLDEALKADATQMTASDIETASSEAGSAARFTYQGLFPEATAAIEGEVTAIVTGGHGLIADAWSLQGDLGEQIAEVHQMLDTIEVAP